MKTINILLATAINGCGADVVETITKDNEAPKKNLSGSCHVVKANGKAKITCPDGSEAIVSDGEKGSNGSDGGNGADGINGADGSDGIDGESGVDGSDGANGSDGSDGTDASEISIYDSSGYKWGVLYDHDKSTVKMTNGHIVGVGSGPNYIMEPPNGRIYFTTSDCSGSTYIRASIGVTETLSYSIIRAKWYGNSGSVKANLASESNEDQSGNCTASSATIDTYRDSVEVDMTGYSGHIDYASGYPRFNSGPLFYE